MFVFAVVKDDRDMDWDCWKVGGEEEERKKELETMTPMLG